MATPKRKKDPLEHLKPKPLPNPNKKRNQKLIDRKKTSRAMRGTK